MSSHEPLQVALFPFMALGHMLPIVDLAKLFSRHGVNATILTTPGNTQYIQPAIDVANANAGDGQRITLHILPFPVEQVGLPKGHENAAKFVSLDSNLKLFKATDLLRQPFDRALAEIRPDAVVTDMFFPWTLDVANDHGIPRLVFHGTSNFSITLSHIKRHYRVVESLPSDAETFTVPLIPHRIEFLKSQEPDHTKRPPAMANLFNSLRESELKSYGVVTNSFYELEPEYVELYRNELGMRTWNVGPLFLCNNDDNDKSQRGEAAAIDEETCIGWLSKKEPNSVIYVSFGSVSQVSPAQLREIALGLESYGGNFIWVVREPKGDENWLPEGFEDRVKSENRGLIIRGWAPQILILNHPSVGGFMTHCGWNSSLEGISAGLPLITWPMFAEQFSNEKLIVEVIKTGVSIGVTKYAWKEEETSDLVRAKQIAKKLSWLMMEGSEEAEEMKERARAIGEAAKKAVAIGGSSYVEMNELIEGLKERKFSSKA